LYRYIKAFSSWRAAVSRGKDEKQKAKDDRVHQQRLARIVANWVKRAMIDAFEGWLEVWEQTQDAKRAAEALQNKLRRAIKKMTHGAMAGAFGNWLSVARESNVGLYNSNAVGP
jgi:hypothetical protein